MAWEVRVVTLLQWHAVGIVSLADRKYEWAAERSLGQPWRVTGIVCVDGHLRDVLIPVVCERIRREILFALTERTCLLERV